MSLPMIAMFGTLVVLVGLVACAANDLRARIIPDKLVIVVLAASFIVCSVERPHQIGLALFGALVVFLSLCVLSHYRVLGGGDVKLVTAVTLIVPPSHIGLLLAQIVFAGGMLSIFYFGAGLMLRNERQTPIPAACVTVAGFQSWLSSERARMISFKSIPYATAILAGVVYYITMRTQHVFS